MSLEFPDNAISTIEEFLELEGQIVYAVKNYPQSVATEIVSISVGPIFGREPGMTYLIRDPKDAAPAKYLIILDPTTDDGEIVRAHKADHYFGRDRIGHSAIFRTQSEAEQWAVIIKLTCADEYTNTKVPYTWKYGWTHTFNSEVLKTMFSLTF